MSNVAATVEGVSKRYGETVALDDVSLTIDQGQIFGIIGPNGAGKSTLVGILAGLRDRDTGTVCVLGLDPERDERQLRERIGIQLQEAQLQELIRVEEAVKLYASFYRNPRPWEPLLEEWNLGEKRQTPFKGLSGGQKQRLLICLALINTPELVILDELTTGLDPQARQASWELIRRVREQGTTVILVTHFMEEIEKLCDRVAVIDHGRVVALDTPAGFMRQDRESRQILFTADDTVDQSRLEGLPGVSSVTSDGREFTVTGSGFLMAEIAAELSRQNINPPDLRTQSDTMETVFMRLTGEHARD